jgi:hypothetical protein
MEVASSTGPSGGGGGGGIGFPSSSTTSNKCGIAKINIHRIECTQLQREESRSSKIAKVFSILVIKLLCTNVVKGTGLLEPTGDLFFLYFSWSLQLERFVIRGKS